jgi:HSP20 family protein
MTMIIRRFYELPSESNPFSELNRMRSEMESLFGRLAESLPTGSGPGVFPLINITEDHDCLFVRAELPGVKANEIEISATGNSLSIGGERKVAPENEVASYHRREREAGVFRRTITLPSDIDANRVEANYTNGILTVTLPKAELSKPKQISVKAA